MTKEQNMNDVNDQGYNAYNLQRAEERFNESATEDVTGECAICGTALREGEVCEDDRDRKLLMDSLSLAINDPRTIDKDRYARGIRNTIRSFLWIATDSEVIVLKGLLSVIDREDTMENNRKRVTTALLMLRGITISPISGESTK